MEITRDLWLLIAWTVALTALLVVHVLVTWLGLRAATLGWRWRALSILPPAAPIVAWAAGRRVAPILWLVLVVVYLGLRALE